MNEREIILDKVRKLHAKANNKAITAAEAEMFTAKVSELMNKYAIHMHEVNEKQLDHVEKLFKIKSIRVWKRALMSVCAHTTFCQLLYIGFGNSNKIIIVGRPMYIGTCIEMFEYIVKQIEQIARSLYPYSNKAAMRCMAGIVVGIENKMRNIKNHDQRSKLPVIQERTASREALDKLFPDVKTKQTKKKIYSIEHSVGIDHASRIKIFEDIDK